MANTKNKAMIKKFAFALSLITALTALIYFTPSCNDYGKYKANEPSKPGTVKILAVITDSGKVSPAIIIRQISKTVKVDSATGKETIVTDTLYGVEKPFPRLDSLRRPIKDSAGNIQYQMMPVVIKSDSVNTHVENIPLEILLDRSKWKKQ